MLRKKDAKICQEKGDERLTKRRKHQKEEVSTERGVKRSIAGVLSRKRRTAENAATEGCQEKDLSSKSNEQCSKSLSHPIILVGLQSPIYWVV